MSLANTNHMFLGDYLQCVRIGIPGPRTLSSSMRRLERLRLRKSEDGRFGHHSPPSQIGISGGLRKGSHRGQLRESSQSTNQKDPSQNCLFYVDRSQYEVNISPMNPGHISETLAESVLHCLH
jgi:hypothetical protein